MDSTKSSATAPTTTHERGVCADCGETGRALQAPRANVGTGYAGPMFCRPCNLRFRALDFHYASLERMTV